ncbi:hypothetical protein THAOC_25278 [Thalassiosira oceanica]|uniref:Uncharacterized protein n=1 Tax=Thalassiosira oceanica TaxID=159749 RepID=K0RPI4_THAOC|nr:hypothetical protein THAOC_25278 [Thalassiosira oceanica]|eukprot:EJK55035.1 hypothetical protein THAOC_25278 [Thalassiosira oceanica]
MCAGRGETNDLPTSNLRDSTAYERSEGIGPLRRNSCGSDPGPLTLPPGPEEASVRCCVAQSIVPKISLDIKAMLKEYGDAGARETARFLRFHLFQPWSRISLMPLCQEKRSGKSVAWLSSNQHSSSR